ncbi:integral membrane protein [Aspergillus sclerotialis]|uniref:Integral membrane protein n=1 Tax=Aspergillus sclerotialis TaxID=2070753 RepID=A0A3A2ZIB8_9EURO|nr:integral membrane protein [Aspergillus sclerotialis]
MTNGVLWMEIVIVAGFVGLCPYTRKQILNAVGLDDYLVLFYPIYDAFVSTSSHSGLGRKSADIGDPHIYVTAAKYEIFSQVAGIMAIGVGKLAVGSLLLRIVRNKIQIIII